ncbi:atherin-like [Schistocerca serialis cubense]|uniref:atherin-like n=1 Tax=Schistocerca serialis cubense TaxID=2023355 RepID=UPI00214EC890|nr:atherin-like [Schistocerca serialis cubense]
MWQVAAPVYDCVPRKPEPGARPPARVASRAVGSLPGFRANPQSEGCHNGDKPGRAALDPLSFTAAEPTGRVARSGPLRHPELRACATGRAAGVLRPPQADRVGQPVVRSREILTDGPPLALHAPAPPPPPPPPQLRPHTGTTDANTLRPLAAATATAAAGGSRSDCEPRSSTKKSPLCKLESAPLPPRRGRQPLHEIFPGPRRRALASTPNNKHPPPPTPPLALPAV